LARVVGTGLIRAFTQSDQLHFPGIQPDAVFLTPANRRYMLAAVRAYAGTTAGIGPYLGVHTGTRLQAPWAGLVSRSTHAATARRGAGRPAARGAAASPPRRSGSAGSRSEPVAERAGHPGYRRGLNRVLDAERDAALGVAGAPDAAPVGGARAAAGCRGVGVQTAEAIGSTPGAVRVTQHRALLRLRRIIAHEASTATTAELDAANAAPE
jgi:hypothetical protein